jgi:oligoribonuclease NrnB/cAMP/cGMP phosphodiesterase (DHH superfamily)
MEYSSIFMEQGITKPLFNRILSETNNYYKLEKLQQQYMESKERKLCNNQPSRIKTEKIIEFGWMDHHQWKEESRNIRKSYYLVSSHVKPLTAKL